MPERKDIRFFPIFMGATAGVLLEIVGTFNDEIITGQLFDDETFASVNLITPYMWVEAFLAYLVTVASAALIVRARGADDNERMSNIFSQTIIMCALTGTALSLIYILFTPSLVRFVADDPAVYDNALSYFTAIRFYPIVDMFDTFLFTYVLYRGGYILFYIAVISRVSINAALSWYLGSRMGVMGIGIASIVSLLVAVCIKLTFLLTKKHGLKFRWYFNVKDEFEIAKLGFPESALYMFGVIFELVVNTFTLKNYGADGVAAVAVVINLFEVVLYLSEGISEYEIVAVNDSIGKNSSKSMDHCIKIVIRAALIEGAVLAGVIFMGSEVLPWAFDIDNEATAAHSSLMVRIFAPAAPFICFARIFAIFYQYTRRIKRTVILFGMTVALLPPLFVALLGRIAIEGEALGIALGTLSAVALMYVYVRVIKREKMFDYALMDLDRNEGMIG